MSEDIDNKENESAINAEIKVETFTEFQEPKVEEKNNHIAEEPKNVEPEVIVAPEPEKIVPGMGYLNDGVMGSTTVKKTEKKHTASKESKKETVAIYSTRNVTWAGVGKVYIGYNIVSKDASEQWLKRDHVRLATPEEVAKEFNK